MLVDFFGWVAAVINFIAFFIYFQAIRNKSTTSGIAWLLSTIIVFLTAISQYSVSGLSNSAAYFIGFTCCSYSFFLSRHGLSTITNTDAITIIFAVVIAFLYIVVEPSWSIYCLCFYYLLTYSVFIRAIKNGAVEPIIPWLIWCLCAVMQILSISISVFSVQAFILPVTNFLCWISVVIVSSMKSKVYIKY